MKRLRWKELVVLSLPMFALVGLGVFLPKNTSPLALRTAQVVPIPLKQRNPANPFYPDTRLTIDIARQKPFLLNGLWGSRVVSYQKNSTHLLDAKGRKYFWLKGYSGPEVLSNIRGASGDESHTAYLHEFHFGQIPRSAGTITFNATYVTDGGFELPVSVVVRS